MRLSPILTRSGSRGPTGPRLVVVSSAPAGTVAARSATSAQVAPRAERFDRENWTIEVASFQFQQGIISRCCIAQEMPQCSDKTMLQCKTDGRRAKPNG